MKMNKLAAGALALALGLGAVAPAVAAETKTAVQYTGAQHFLTEYNKDLKEVNELYAKYVAAQEVEEAKLEVLKAKKAALELAIKNFEDYVGRKEVVSKIVEIKGANEDKTLEKVVLEIVREDRNYHTVLAREAYNKILELTGTVGKAKLGEFDAIIATENWEIPALSLDMSIIENTDENRLALSEAMDTLQYEHAYLYKTPLKQEKIMALAKKLRVAVLERNIAQKEYDDAVAARKAAYKAYKDKLEVLDHYAAKYNVVIHIGHDGIKVIDKADSKVDPIAPSKKSKAELIKALKKAIEDNKIAIHSAEFLLENAPKSVAKVKAKLEKQIADAKATIEKSEKALAKYEKVALVATAYADEETDELEALIKENEDSADAINETIKENEKEQPAVDEEEDDEEEEEEKPEKPENKPARQAGTNARTGIAGVAGVAGILAAASVAYAASKRD